MKLTDTAQKMFRSAAHVEADEINGQIDRVVIAHKSFRDAYKGIMECVMESTQTREPVNCMLLGDGGSGKTTMAQLIESSFEREVIRENDLEIDTVPVIVTSFKSMRSVDALVTDVLWKLGDLNPISGKVPDKGDRAVKLMESCHTQIVIIDELHDLEGFEEGDLETMRPFLKWVKGITNSHGPAVCLVGNAECEDIFERERGLEMARRFKRRFFLHPLSLGTQDKPGTLPEFLRNVCTGILQKTSLKSFPPLHLYEYALKVWVSTSGNTAYVMDLIKLAVKNAVFAGRHEVTNDDFAEAWGTGFFHKVAAIKANPFKMKVAEIANELRRKSL